MQNVRQKNLTLERWIAKAYIFLLPIRMIAPFTFLQSIIGSCAGSFDLILHILGVSVYLLNNRGVVRYSKDDKSIKLLTYFIQTVLIVNITSLVMSVFIQSRFGSIGGESAYEATLIMCVYFLQFACMMLYNKHVFSLLTKEEILKILYCVVNCLLVLGYVQILVLELGGTFRTLYETIDILNIISAPNMPKLWLTGSEGSHAGELIAVFVLPILLSKICVKKARFIDLISLLLWLPIAYYTHSAMAWLLIVLTVFAFGLIYVRTVKKQSLTTTLVFGIFLVIVGGVLILFILNVLPEEITEEVSYLLFEKALSKEDGSTATRVAQFYINFGAFSEYPIFGVGNGNQGYFYAEYFPEWALNVAGTDAGVIFQRAQNQIANGASFTLSLMSGYGIVGILLFGGFIVKSIGYARRYKKEMGQFYYIMLISWVAILGASFQSGFLGDYLIFFMLSLPLMVRGGLQIEVEKYSKSTFGNVKWIANYEI